MRFSCGIGEALVDIVSWLINTQFLSILLLEQDEIGNDYTHGNSDRNFGKSWAGL